MTLRTIHLVFILFAIFLADMLGAWAIYHRSMVEGPLLFWLGILSLLGGLALCGYAFFFTRKMDEAGIH